MSDQTPPAQAREALQRLFDHCASQGWWLGSHAVDVMNAARDALAVLRDHPVDPPQGVEKRIALSLRLGRILGPDYDGVSLEDVARELVALKHRLAVDLGLREQEIIERCAEVADRWATSPSCHQHENNPCCHVRTGAGIAAAIRALVLTLASPPARPETP